MRKLLNRKSMVIAGLAVLAVALLLFSRGGDDASAAHGTTAFPPTPFVNNLLVGFTEDGAECSNATNDDASITDTLVNDGCPPVGPPEVGGQCLNASDDEDNTPSFNVTAEFKDNSPSADTIERIEETGSWLDHGWSAGETVIVSGTIAIPVTNSGSFLIDSITALVVTLDSGESLTNEGPKAANFNVFVFDGVVNDGCPAVGTSDAAGVPNGIIQFSSQNVFDSGGAFPPLNTPRFGGHTPSSGILFTPADWTVVPGSLIPNGSPVGGTLTATTLGFGNGPCLATVPIAATAVDSETDTGNTIVVVPNFPNLIVDDFDPASHAGFPQGDDPQGTPHGDGNLVADGADYYPDILVSAIPPDIVGDPIQRSYVQLPSFLGTTTNVIADIVTYAPDQLVPLGIPAGRGYATVVVIENFNGALAPTPSLITDQCGFETSLFTAAGLRVNPTTPGTKLFFGIAQSRRDADGDGFDNDGDRCPFSPDPAFPLSTFGPFPASFKANFPLDFDASGINGIPNSCDPGTGSTSPTLAPFCIPTNALLCAGADGDLDAFPNAQDNCPQVPNGPGVPGSGFQDESEPLTIAIPVPTGPASDAIGDACDPNPTVADGHFHTVESFFPVCITGGGVVDTDGDGWCDPDETSLGSDKTDADSTPEDLSITGTCSDGLDNDDEDGDGLNSTGADIADAGCREGDGSHDLEIVKITGSKSITAQGKATLNVKIKNLTTANETVVLGIQVTGSTATGGLPGCYPITAQLAGEPEVTANGPLGTVSVPGSGVTLHVKIQVPVSCSAAAGPGGDYLVRFDICHAGDPGPLGLFGEGGCPGSSDGDQDRNSANDAPSLFPQTLDQP